MQRFSYMHQNEMPNWDLVPEKHKVLKSLIKQMMEKAPSERPEIDKVISVLERVNRETLVDTRGSRLENLFFPKDRFNWNPRLHETLDFRRKIYFLKTSKPIEDFQRICEKIRAVTDDGFTAYVTYGSKDIVLLCWEGPGGCEFGSILAQYANDLDYEPIQPFDVGEIQFGGSVKEERWERMKPNQILDEVIDNTHTLAEPDLETWLSKKRYILANGDYLKKLRRVRLLVNVKSIRNMKEAERESLVESLREVLRISFEELRGVEKHSYRIYSDIRSDDPGEHGRNIFAEIHGKDLYWCSQCVVAIMREVNRRRVRAEQRYFYSSHIQFSPELIWDSEDGALNKLLADRNILRPSE